VVSTDK
jgi:glycerol-1-phosphatase